MSVKSRRRAAKAQATTASALQFLPQAQALSQLLRSTTSGYQDQVAETKSYAASVRANALSQVNPLTTALRGIADQQRADQATSAGRLAAIGPGGSDYASSAAREAQAANARLSSTQSGAVTELNSRAADALSGGQFATQNLTSKYNLDRQKIQDQIAGLAQQQGLYTAKAYQDSLQSLRQQDITLAGVRGANKRAASTLAETTRHHKQTEAQAATNAANKKKSGGAGSKPLTPAQASKVKDQVNSAVTWIGRLSKNKNASSHQIRQMLEAGDTIHVPFKDPATGVTKTQDVKLPAVPHDLINAAYDLFAFGTLSHPNRVALLHGRRVPRGSLPASWFGPRKTPKGASVPSLYGSAR